MSGTNSSYAGIPSADFEAVDLCLKANTAGTGYAIGDQVVLTRWFNTSSGTPVQTSEVAFNITQGGAVVATPLTAANFDECPSGGLTYSETVVCAAGVQMIRRTASDGTVTFVTTNGAAAATPPAYTIGACVPTANDYEEVTLCLKANTAGTGYAIGDQVVLTRWYNVATGTPVQVAEIAYNTTNGGAVVTTPLTAANFDECPSGGLTYSEVIVCAAGVQMIRRTASDGTVTFVTTNGAAAATPPAYTIGACVPTANDYEEVTLCLKANTAGTGYAIGDQVVLTRWYNVATGTPVQVAEIAYNTTNGGAIVTTPLTAANFDECASVAPSTTRLIQTYRISGTAAGTSTPSTVPGDNPTVGNTVTIAAGFRSLSWEFLRQTAQDPGTGATARLTVNGFISYPGSGTQYQTNGKVITIDNGDTSLNAYQFTATGQAHVEITVIR